MPAPQKLQEIFGKFFHRMWEDISAFELIFFLSFRCAQDFRNNRPNEGNFSAFLLTIRYSLAKPLGRANAITLQMASCRHRSDFDTVTLGLHLHCNKNDEEWPLLVRPRWKVMGCQKPLLIRPQTLVLFAAVNIFTSNDKPDRWSRIWLLRPTSIYRWRHCNVMAAMTSTSDVTYL